MTNKEQLLKNCCSESRPQKITYTSENQNQDLFQAMWYTPAHIHRAELWTPKRGRLHLSSSRLAPELCQHPSECHLREASSQTHPCCKIPLGVYGQEHPQVPGIPQCCLHLLTGPQELQSWLQKMHILLRATKGQQQQINVVSACAGIMVHSNCLVLACSSAWIWPRLMIAFPNDAWTKFRDQYKLRGLPVLNMASLLWGAEGFSCWTEATLFGLANAILQFLSAFIYLFSHSQTTYHSCVFHCHNESYLLPLWFGHDGAYQAIWKEGV